MLITSDTLSTFMSKNKDKKYLWITKYNDIKRYSDSNSHRVSTSLTIDFVNSVTDDSDIYLYGIVPIAHDDNFLFKANAK